MTETERTAVISLFELKAELRSKISEWESCAERAAQPQTKKWYRFMGQEVQKVLDKVHGITPPGNSK